MTTAELETNVGKFATALETGWIGKIVAVEEMGDDVLYKMIGVDTAAMMIGGGSAEDNLTSDDVQWFVPADVELI